MSSADQRDRHVTLLRQRNTSQSGDVSDDRSARRDTARRNRLITIAKAEFTASSIPRLLKTRSYRQVLARDARINTRASFPRKRKGEEGEGGEKRSAYGTQRDMTAPRTPSYNAFRVGGRDSIGSVVLTLRYLSVARACVRTDVRARMCGLYLYYPANFARHGRPRERDRPRV